MEVSGRPAHFYRTDDEPAPTPAVEALAFRKSTSAPPRIERRPRVDPWLRAVAEATADWLLTFGFVFACWAVLLRQNWSQLTLGQVAPVVAAALGLHLGAELARRVRARRQLCLGAGAVSGWVVGALFAASDPGALAALVATCAAAMELARLLFDFDLDRAREKRAVREAAVIVGATDAARRFIRRNKTAGDAAVDIVAIFDDRSGRAPPALEGVPVFGAVDDLLAWPDLPHVDQILLTIGPAAEDRAKDLVARLRCAPNRVLMLLDLEALTPEPTQLLSLAGAPVAQLAGVPADPVSTLMKRGLDIAIALGMLAFFAPLMACIALAVKLDSPGPAIFRQPRQGLNGRAFTVFKFRTMRVAPATNRLHQVTANDPRVTRLGKLLRRTSLDELPQLVNVLVGDMSLVGPRPHAEDMRVGETPCAEIEPRYLHRCRVKPGLTGWAQINGSRGPLDTDKAVKERIDLDLAYIQRASPLFDLWILLRTAPALLGDRLRIR